LILYTTLLIEKIHLNKGPINQIAKNSFVKFALLFRNAKDLIDYG